MWQIYLLTAFGFPLNAVSIVKAGEWLDSWRWLGVYIDRILVWDGSWIPKMTEFLAAPDLPKNPKLFGSLQPLVRVFFQKNVLDLQGPKVYLFPIEVEARSQTYLQKYIAEDIGFYKFYPGSRSGDGFEKRPVEV